MKRIYAPTSLLAILILITACSRSNVKFDKVGWNTSGDGIACPPLREKMLDDLLRNHKLKGLSYRQLVDKLGEQPKCETCEPNTISYEVIVDYGFTIDPDVTTLDFYFDKDSVITDWKIIEYKDNQPKRIITSSRENH